MNYEVDYKDRMINYYPQVISAIKEFQAIVDTEAPELSNIHDSMNVVLDNSYLYTMNEERIKQWEKILDINMSADSLEERRDIIIARIRGQGKLNTSLINSIVGTFTGGTAESWVENGILHVKVTPHSSNKSYRFENIENELRNKVPCHLGLEVTRNYYTWENVKNSGLKWGDVLTSFGTWEEVLLYVAS